MTELCDCPFCESRVRGIVAIRYLRAVAVLALLIPIVGCSAGRPLLYPNAKYGEVGAAGAESDVDFCLSIAEQDGSGAVSDTTVRVAGNAGTAAAGGAASRAAVGGNAGRGAAAGAAGAAARTVFRALFVPRGPSVAARRVVERCLRERGYEPMGWH